MISIYLGEIVLQITSFSDAKILFLHSVSLITTLQVEGWVGGSKEIEIKADSDLLEVELGEENTIKR